MDADLGIPQELYESDIDFSISCMARAGFLVELGNESDIVDGTDVASYAEACGWLKDAAVRNFPASAFGKKYRGEAKVFTLPKPKHEPSWSS